VPAVGQERPAIGVLGVDLCLGPRVRFAVVAWNSGAPDAGTAKVSQAVDEDDRCEAGRIRPSDLVGVDVRDGGGGLFGVVVMSRASSGTL
jgi:hypothetical protein